MQHHINILAIALFSACASSAASPGDSHQALVRIQIIKNGIPLAGGAIVAEPLGGFLSLGTLNNYLRMRCEPGRRELDSIPVFAGFSVQHRVSNEKIVFDIAEFSVRSPEEEILKVPSDGCEELWPRQEKIFSQSVEIPFVNTSVQQSKKILGEYELHYYVSGASK